MSEIIGSLFGVTADQYQRNRDLEQDRMAFELAQADIGTRSRYLLQSGARGLGNVIGRALGGEDPELQRISRRQQIMGMIDPNQPETFEMAAQAALESGQPELAFGLRTEAETYKRKVLESDALIFQRMKEKEVLAPEKVRVAQAVAERAGPVGSPEYNAAYDAYLNPAKAPETQVVETARGQILIDKLTGKELANLGPSPDRSSRTNITTEVKQAPDIAAAISAFDKTVLPYRETYNSTENAQQLLNEASKSKNSQAFEAARTILAKAIGENKLSNEDIRRTGIDPRLVQGALDWVNKKIEGVPNEDIIKQMYAVSTALRNKSASRINEQADRAQEAAKASNFKGDLQLYFPKISVNIPPTKSGASDADYEARYQAYASKRDAEKRGR
jgi:hypothetical protein